MPQKEMIPEQLKIQTKLFACDLGIGLFKCYLKGKDRTILEKEFQGDRTNIILHMKRYGYDFVKVDKEPIVIVIGDLIDYKFYISCEADDVLLQEHAMQYLINCLIKFGYEKN